MRCRRFQALYNIGSHLPFTILPYIQLLVTLLANIQQFVDGVCRSVGIGRADLHFIDVGV